MGNCSGYGDGAYPEASSGICQRDWKRSAPERITYEIRHKHPKEATLKSVHLFEERLKEYLSQKDWGYIK